jgi:hypothetical protein
VPALPDVEALDEEQFAIGAQRRARQEFRCFG